MDLLDFFYHTEEYISLLLQNYNYWVYAILFIMIFCESGILIMAFLPGDTLLLAAGAISAREPELLNIHLLFILLIIAKITGNCLNYFIGTKWRRRVFHSRKTWIVNKQKIQKAHRYYKRFGNEILILAGFIPIVRTFASFIAGVVKMPYRQFFIYNVVGALLWIGTLLYGSYWFENIPIIRENFSIVILFIILLIIVPPLFNFVRKAFTKRKRNNHK